MDEFDRIAGDICEHCRHTLRDDDTCALCGWQPGWAALSVAESDRAGAGIATRTEGLPALLSDAQRRKEGIAPATRRSGDNLLSFRGF